MKQGLQVSASLLRGCHFSYLFFFISKNSLKSAEGRNPSTHEVYKSVPK